MRRLFSSGRFARRTAGEQNQEEGDSFATVHVRNGISYEILGTQYPGTINTNDDLLLNDYVIFSHDWTISANSLSILGLLVVAPGIDENQEFFGVGKLTLNLEESLIVKNYVRVTGEFEVRDIINEGEFILTDFGDFKSELTVQSIINRGTFSDFAGDSIITSIMGAGVNFTNDEGGTIEGTLKLSRDDDTFNNLSSENVFVDAGEGDDLLISGSGRDDLNGGDGIDTVSYVNAAAMVTVDLAAGTAIGGTGEDGLANIENVIGSVFGDTITGSSGDNILEGGLGDDTIDGSSGLDFASYASATSSVTADLLDGTSSGGAGQDTLLNIEGLIGSEFGDVLAGTNQNDFIYGGSGNDELFGRNGADVIFGGSGDDLLLGGNRDDVLFGETGNDRVFGGNGNDTLEGSLGDDIIRGGNNDDFMNGGDGNDVMFGGTGIDIMVGGLGDDILEGRGGFDNLRGGGGDDILTGGNQADEFLFSDGWGNDTITDFASLNDAENIILTDVTEITDFDDLAANHMSQVGENVVITDGLGNSITLLGVTVADLDVEDFVF